MFFTEIEIEKETEKTMCVMQISSWKGISYHNRKNETYIQTANWLKPSEREREKECERPEYPKTTITNKNHKRQRKKIQFDRKGISSGTKGSTKNRTRWGEREREKKRTTKSCASFGLLSDPLPFERARPLTHTFSRYKWARTKFKFHRMAWPISTHSV